MRAKQGQSFFDLVIQGTGNIENAFAMSILNGVSITAELNIDQKILPAGEIKTGIIELWEEKNLPATALTNANFADVIADDGIGAMIIDDTFIVR